MKTSCRGIVDSTTMELGTRANGSSAVSMAFSAEAYVENDAHYSEDSTTGTRAEKKEEEKMIALLQKIRQLEEENEELRKMCGGTHQAEENLHHFWPRLGWLLGLLLLQSISSVVLKSYHKVLELHPSIIYFLTMLVGAGGNVGGQSAVLVVRGLATNRRVSPQIIVGLQLAFFLGLATLARTFLQGVSFQTSLALTMAMWCIVVMGCTMGQAFPLMYQKMGIDPAHSSATIQVFMDIAGISLTCFIVWMMLESDGSEHVDHLVPDAAANLW